MKQYILSTLIASAALTGAAGPALAQNWDRRDARQDYRRDVRDAQKDYRRDIRDARRDYREEVWQAKHRSRLRYAPRRGVAVREYIYYPQARAYYAPWNKRWYYRHNNRWVVAHTAPVNIRLGNGLTISLGADSPVVYDTYVVNNYRRFYR